MFKLTFNRPAVRQFIEGNDTHGLRIRTTDDGKVQFLPATSSEDDSAPLAPRTRGGYESFVEGKREQEILDHLKNPFGGPFFVLKRVSDGWVQAEPYEGRDAPPKFEPHVRVWHAAMPKAEGKVASPVRAKTKPKIAAEATPIDIAERVRWAYDRLSGERRPGRPSREMTEAREIRQSFEAAVTEFMSNLPSKGDVDLKAIAGLYHQLGAFLKTAAPETLDPIPLRRPRKAKAQVVIGEKDPAMAREVMKKLGLKDATPAMVPGGKAEMNASFAHA